MLPDEISEELKDALLSFWAPKLAIIFTLSWFGKPAFFGDENRMLAISLLGHIHILVKPSSRSKAWKHCHLNLKGSKLQQI